MELAFCFALALFISSVLVPVAIRLAPSMGLVDLPDDDRKIHQNPIPRCGGLAIIFAVFLPVILWLDDVHSYSGLLIGALIIALFGFLDDRYNLNYKWKFIGQVLGVFIFLSSDFDINKTPFFGLGDVTPILSYTVLAFFILGVTNAVNLTDGLDGLAAGSSLLGLGFLAYLSFFSGETSLALILISVMGSILGFLRFNTHPATVFMGDAGSQFLGYLAACLAILVTQAETTPVSPILALIIVGIPVLDTLMVMILRIKSGHSPFFPDRQHIHHQLLDLGLKHYQAVAVLYLLNFILLTVAYFTMYKSDVTLLFVYITFCLLTIGLIKILSNSSLLIVKREEGSNRERRNLFLRRLSWFHSKGSVYIQILLACVWIVLIWPLGKQVYFIGILSSVVLFLSLLLLFNVFKSLVLSRAILYIISVLAIYTGIYDQSSVPIDLTQNILLVDIIFVFLVIILALCIRLTRREHFTLNTQDVLVLLILTSSTALVVGFDSSSQILNSAIRLAIMLYAAEFIINRSSDIRLILLFSIITTSVIGLNCFL